MAMHRSAKDWKRSCGSTDSDCDGKSRNAQVKMLRGSTSGVIISAYARTESVLTQPSLKVLWSSGTRVREMFHVRELILSEASLEVECNLLS